MNMAVLNNSNMRKNSIDQSLISAPTTMDILCGKDKTYAKHPANKTFRDMIVSYAEVYSKASTKQGKMQLTKEIVTTLQQSYNARFLQPSRCGSGWVEISDQVARDKTSHALRFAAKSSGSSCNNSVSSEACNNKRKSVAAATHKKGHRRQVSWNVLDGSCVPTVGMDRTRSPSPLLTQSRHVAHEDLEPIDWKQNNPNTELVFERQQVILKTLVDQAEIGFSSQFAGPLVMSRHEFDSLRSEDFESLMNDPVLMNAIGEIPDEWDADKL